MKNSNVKKILVSLSVVSMFGLVGCSSTKESEQAKMYHDEQMAIINDMNNTKETGMADEVKSYDEYGTDDSNETSSNSELDNTLNNLKFEKYDQKSNVKYYKTDITNEGYKDYAIVNLKVELLDENGETLDLLTITGLENWKAGETREIKFMTSKNFSSIKYHHEEY